MTDAQPYEGRRGFFERHERGVIRGLAYGLLVLVTVVDVCIRGGFTAHARADIYIAAGGALWMAPMTVWRPAMHDERFAFAFFLGLIAVMATLVVRSPIYGFWSFTGYFWTGLYLGGWRRYLGVLLTAACAAISQTGGAPAIAVGALAIYVGAFALNAGVATAVSRAWWAEEIESERRKLAIGDLTEANRRLRETLEENAALQAQLVAQAREAGVAEERRRMAREIHDTLAQGLTGIIAQLQAAQQGHGVAGREHLDTAIALARESLTEARRSVQALAPGALEDARLPEALRDVAERWSSLHGLSATVTTTGGARPMRAELEVALLRVAQEALANVAKHARASQARVTLSYMEDQVTLDVVDDGVGFAIAAPLLPVAVGTGARPDGGFGLAAMRERIDGAGGRLEIESEPGGGTAISASVPVGDDE